MSVDGETYRGSNEYDISVLEDQPPTISFDRPGRDQKATNLEEVFTQARAEDDYGVVAMDLHFSVNGGEEKKVNLQELTRESAPFADWHSYFLPRRIQSKARRFHFLLCKGARRGQRNYQRHLFHRSEAVRDGVSPVAATRRWRWWWSGGDQDQNALSRRQKDLIAATHKLLREGEKYTPQERKDGYEAVAAGQEKLRTDTLEFLDRMGRRLGDQIEGQKEMAEMAGQLKQAAAGDGRRATAFAQRKRAAMRCRPNSAHCKTARG